ncbi:MAG: BatA domain-containing protein [Verrucomicrobiales bacterium]|nr:BatA domain-containing protein [Verrucomicrobiales bacterium]
MSFLNPGLLALAAAVAIPVLIHLLNRRRFKRVTWAAMRFVRASVEKNRRRMELEDLLLLLLRCLIVALFAVALARPALRSAAAFLGTGRVAAVIVLDHSASLAADEGGMTRMDEARAAAEAVVDAYPSGSSLAVLLSGDRVTEELPEPTRDPLAVRRALREAPLSDLASDHAPALARAAEILRETKALGKEVVLITDRQALGWRRVSEVGAALGAAGADARLRVVLVGGALDANLAVSALTLSPGFVSSRDPIRLHAEIANRGTEPMRDVRATVHVDRGPAVDEAVLSTLGAGETRRVTFFAKLPSAGFHAITVKLPTDRFPADDERSVVVRAVDRVQVMVVDGDPESNSAFFLRNALQPVPEAEAAAYYLQPRVVPPGQVALARLSDFDAVVLADIPALAAPAVDALTRYVAEGGVVLVFPGPRAQAAFYNDELLKRAGWLPAALGTLRGQPEAGPDEPGFALQGPPYDHPVFSLWNEPGSGLLTAARFRAAWQLTPATAPAIHVAAQANATLSPGSITNQSSAGRVMIRYSDGAPAVVERELGLGRVLMFSSTAGTAWNDFAVRPAFLPLLHRSVASTAGRRDVRYNLAVGDTASLRLAAEWTGRDVGVLAPGEPERRLTRTLRAGVSGALLEFDETSRAGVYRVDAPGEAAALLAFATQLDPAESDLTELSAERLAELGRSCQVVTWSSGMDLRAAFDRERVGVELWLPLALAVLLLGITETWLAQTFSRSK